MMDKTQTAHQCSAQVQQQSGSLRVELDQFPWKPPLREILYGSLLASNPDVPTFFAYSKNAVRLGALLTCVTFR